MIKYIGGRVSEQSHDRLHEIAKREGRSVASIIRYLVDFYIFGHEETEKEDTK